MKHVFYVILALILLETGYGNLIIPLLQAQTPPPKSTDTPKKEEPISPAVLKSLGLESYRYENDPRNRDPFISLKQETGEDGEVIINQTMLGPYLPLERFDIDQFQLMGIIWDTDDPRALFLDPNSQSHIVRKNDRIGLYKGHLAEIREGEVIIAEPKQQGLTIQYNIKTLSIKKDQTKSQKSKNTPANQ